VEAAALADDPASREMLVDRYRVPQPRVALAAAVRDFATASMDVSDGLAGDLTKLCSASGVSADIALSRLPTSSAGAKLLALGATRLENLISGGDDYEIMCTVPATRREAFTAAAVARGIAVSDIGSIVEGPAAPRFFDGQGCAVTLKRLSFSHF